MKLEIFPKFQNYYTPNIITTDDLVLQLINYIYLFDKKLIVKRFDAPVNGVKCFIEFFYPSNNLDVNLTLLSEDMQNYKFILSFNDKNDSSYTLKSILGFDTSVIRARIFSLASRREIHLGPKVDYGFVEMRDYSSISTLFNTLRLYLSVYTIISTVNFQSQ